VKDRSVNSLVAKVNSAKLHHFLFQALPLDTVTDHVSPSYDLKILLENYAALKSLLCKIEAIGDDFHGSINEVRLFVRDFLLDNSIWSSFGMGHLYKLGILSASHWQDVQSWTAARNLDDIEQMLFPKSEARNKEIEIDSPTRSNSSYHDLNKQLWDTVKLGNYDLVQALLASQDRPVGVSSLTVVLIGGHLDIFWLFFEHGAGLSCKLLQWMAGPIYIAASRGYLEAVRSMVRRARIQNPFGVPAYPLRAAAAAGHIEIVGYFLSLGADIDAPWSTVSPLASAAENGHLAMVRYLVKMGAKLDDQTLVAAIERHDFPTAEFLLEHRALANSRDRKYLGKFPRPALTVAINENDIPIFQLLLEHGADVNGGLNPDDRVLLKPSFEVRAGNSPCQKPIFAAVYRNNLGFAQSLVRHGASITKAERKALLKVAKSGDNPELLNLILAIPIFDRSSPVSNSAYTPSVRPEIEKERKLEEPSRCRVLAEIKAKERWVFKQSLRESFLRSHNKFLDETSKPKTSYTLTVFASEIPLAQSVWKKGIASIRGLLSNQLPSTLMEVFSSIQVSYAMRFALDSGEPKITIGGQPDLSADLDRWRLVVPTDEQSLFDDIARAVWDKSYRTASCQVDWRYEQETLEYFQKLMTSLITASHASCIVGGGLDLGGERLIVIQERFAVLNQVAWENRKTTSLSTRQSLEEHYDLPGRHPQILDEWKPASPMVILLTATAFFVIIIAFLSGEYNILNTLFKKAC
jgi:ankyrin repeat protein